MYSDSDIRKRLPISDALNREGGSGSVSAQDTWINQHSTAHENDWTTARTHFYPDDNDADLTFAQERRYEELKARAQGKGEQERKEFLRQQRRVKDAEAFVDILRMPQHERERVLRIVRNIENWKFGTNGYEKVLLAICSLVADTNTEELGERIYLTKPFQELMQVVDMTSAEHRHLRNRLRETTDFFDE